MLALTPGANPRRPFRRYAVAVLAAIVVVGVHLFLHRRFGPAFDPLFLVVVGLSAWYGGFGPGLVTLVASGVGALLTTTPSVGTLRVASRVDALDLMAYGVSGLVINGLLASTRRPGAEPRRRANKSRSFAEVSEVLASSLDYRATLSAAARLAVPRLADWCAVDVVDADGRLHRLRLPMWTRRRSRPCGP
jgi:Osmosensitive K+ channel histidine kinase